MLFNYQEHSLKSGIYKITNTHTHRIYIGQTIRFKKRWHDYEKALPKGKGHNKFILNDYAKCLAELGHDDFLEFTVVEVMEGSTKVERNAREDWWIAQHYDNQDQCYNFKEKTEAKERSCFSNTPEATSQKVCLRVTKMWQSADPAKKIKMLGNLMNTPEKMAITSKRFKALWQDPEFKARVMEARARIVTPEFRAMMSAAQQKRRANETLKTPEEKQKTKRENRRKRYQILRTTGLSAKEADCRA